MSDNIERALGRIEGKLDTFIAASDRRESVQDKRLNDHSTRLGRIEQRHAKVIGGVAVVAFLWGVAMKFLT